MISAKIMLHTCEHGVQDVASLCLIQSEGGEGVSMESSLPREGPKSERKVFGREECMERLGPETQHILPQSFREGTTLFQSHLLLWKMRTGEVKGRGKTENE